MRNFLNEYGATSTTVNEITISAAVSEINFTDTTPGDDDWRIYVDGDDFIFEREGTEEFRFDTSDNRLEINGAISCTASADIAGALSVGSLDVSAGSSLGSLTVSGNANIGLQCSAGSLYTSGNADIDGSLKIKGALYTSASVYIQGGDVQYTRSNAGADIKIQVYNSSSSTASNAQIEVVTESNGDPEFRCYNKSAYWVQGIPNNNGNAYCINSGAGLGTASAALVITTSDNVKIPNGDLTVSRAVSGSNVAIKIENTSMTANSDVRLWLYGTAGDSNPHVRFTSEATTNWAVGIDAGNGDRFVICPGFDPDAANPGLYITRARDVTIPNGDLDVAGACNVGSLDVSANSALGSLQVSGNASANTLDITGAAAIGSIDCSGNCDVNGRMAATTLGVQSMFVSANAAPSSAQLTSSFGFAQATAGGGFYGIYSDSATAHHLVMCNGSDWFTAVLTKQT